MVNAVTAIRLRRFTVLGAARLLRSMAIVVFVLPVMALKIE
jgi:hypothetical protein